MIDPLDPDQVPGLHAFGPAVGQSHVERAALEVLRAPDGAASSHLLRCLGHVERLTEREPRTLEAPVTFRTVSNDEARRRGDLLPAVMVVCAGSEESAGIRRGDGSYEAPFDLALTAVYRGADEDDSRNLAQDVALALRLCLLTAGLPALAIDPSDLVWLGDDVDPADDRRVVHAGSAFFRVPVQGAASDRHLLPAPGPDPYEPPDPATPTDRVAVDLHITGEEAGPP